MRLIFLEKAINAISSLISSTDLNVTTSGIRWTFGRLNSPFKSRKTVELEKSQSFPENACHFDNGKHNILLTESPIQPEGLKLELGREWVEVTLTAEQIMPLLEFVSKFGLNRDFGKNKLFYGYMAVEKYWGNYDANTPVFGYFEYYGTIGCSKIFKNQTYVCVCNNHSKTLFKIGITEVLPSGYSNYTSEIVAMCKNMGLAIKFLPDDGFKMWEECNRRRQQHCKKLLERRDDWSRCSNR